MAGWLTDWQVVITWHSASASPTGETVQTVNVTNPRELRDLLDRALRDPYVAHYRWWQRRIWDDTDAPTACECGTVYFPVHISHERCRCGDHMVYRCGCGRARVLPERGPECGPTAPS